MWSLMLLLVWLRFFMVFFSSRRRHTRFKCDWSSDVCSSDLAFLSKRDEALVIDVGGTTTDIGSLRHGFPREANSVVEIGGVRTLFRMPDLLSLGLGGGTIVK